MRGVSKKMLISILTSVIVFVTMVATTFAWVGIFTYANTENFQLNLKTQDLDVNYFLTISATGKKESFSDEANLIDIERQILRNHKKWDAEVIDKFTDSEITSLYSRNCTTEPSTCSNINNQITDFYAINMRKAGFYERTKPNIPYLKFDLYLSVDTKEGIQNETEINSNVYLADIVNTLKGTICEQRLTNLNPYKDMPSIPNMYNDLLLLPDSSNFKINSANACRFSISLYNPIDINDEYTDELPFKTLIYQGGTQIPKKENDVFSLGGNLPEDYNTALRELLIIRPNYKTEKNYSHLNSYSYENDLNAAVSRGEYDLELNESNSKLWTKPFNVDGATYLGVHNGIQTKMKLTIYFWFEGWDSDCVVGINEKPVSLNLTFTAGIDD